MFGEGEKRKTTHCLIKLSSDETGDDAADAVAAAADLRLLHGEAGRFSRESSLQVEADGPLEVPLLLPHHTGLVVLTRLNQPLKIVLTQVVQLRVALGSFTETEG